MIISVKLRYVLIAALIFSVVGQVYPVMAKQTSRQVSVYYVPMQFMFDDTQLTPPGDQLGFIYKNSTYVPIRFISYALDKAVDWDPASYTVAVSNPNEADLAVIDSYKKDREVARAQPKPLDSSKLVPKTISVYEEKITYLFDGKSVKPKDSMAGLIINGRLYVPMRFFSEAVGQKIEWDPQTYTVKAQSQPSEDAVKPEPIATPEPTAAPIIATQPTLAELQAATELTLIALRTRASDAFTALFQESSGRLAKGRALLQGFDAEFAQIKGQLQAQLISYGYDTSCLALYQQKYTDDSSAIRAILANG